MYSHNIDPFGDHHLSCRGQYDKITRHNALRDVILSAARLAALSPQLEAPLLLANSLARPADIFLEAARTPATQRFYSQGNELNAYLLTAWSMSRFFVHATFNA